MNSKVLLMLLVFAAIDFGVYPQSGKAVNPALSGCAINGFDVSPKTFFDNTDQITFYAGLEESDCPSGSVSIANWDTGSTGLSGAGLTKCQAVDLYFSVDFSCSQMFSGVSSLPNGTYTVYFTLSPVCCGAYRRGETKSSATFTVSRAPSDSTVVTAVTTNGGAAGSIALCQGGAGPINYGILGLGLSSSHTGCEISKPFINQPPGLYNITVYSSSAQVYFNDKSSNYLSDLSDINSNPCPSDLTIPCSYSIFIDPASTGTFSLDFLTRPVLDIH